MPRISSLTRLAYRLSQVAAPQRQNFLEGAQNALRSTITAEYGPSLCTCNKGVCGLHSSAAPLSAPDNKPTPAGKDQKDPENVKYDTPTRDPGDTADVAPGYYDDHGKGGERELAWEEQRKPDEGDPSYSPGDMPKNWKPEKADDPTMPKREDPLKADVPDMEDSPAEDNPNQDPPLEPSNQGAGDHSYPDNVENVAGFTTPDAPVASADIPGAENEIGSKWDKEESPTESLDKGVAEKIEEEGKVRVGETPPRPDASQTHRYK